MCDLLGPGGDFATLQTDELLPADELGVLAYTVHMRGVCDESPVVRLMEEAFEPLVGSVRGEDHATYNRVVLRLFGLPLPTVPVDLGMIRSLQAQMVEAS